MAFKKFIGGRVFSCPTDLPHVTIRDAKTLRNYIYISATAATEFRLKPKDRIELYFDQSRRVVGLKKITSGATAATYSLGQSGLGNGLKLAFGMYRRAWQIEDVGVFELKQEGDMLVFELDKKFESEAK